MMSRSAPRMALFTRSPFRLRVFFLLAAALCAGCVAAAPKQPLYLVPEFSAVAVRTISLAPTSYDPRYDPTFDRYVDEELRKHLRAGLAKKGYRVVPAQSAADATMTVHVDYLILGDYSWDYNPPPMISIEGEARLAAQGDGRELWRDQASARLGGGGGGRLFYPDLDRQVAFSIFADRLFATLPPVPGIE